MKFAVLLTLLSVVSFQVLGQTDTTRIHSIKADYLKKSKTQKTVAWVLLGTGTALIVTGFIMVGNSNNPLPYPLPPTDTKTYDGAGLILLGGLVDLVSIPFFISGAKNKGRSMAVSLKNEPIPQYIQGHFTQHSISAIAFKLSL
jgi:hypothetical protein